MNIEMRRQLAQQSFEQKIRKVAELIRLSRRLKAERVREDASERAKPASRNPK